MNTRIIHAVVAMLVSLTGYASGGCVNFSVTDSVGEPVAYATVRIYQMPDTVKAVVLDVTDADGSFTASLPGKADYSLALSSVGMEPVSRRFAVGDDGSADLGVIVMRRGAAMLDEDRGGGAATADQGRDRPIVVRHSGRRRF